MPHNDLRGVRFERHVHPLYILVKTDPFLSSMPQ